MCFALPLSLSISPYPFRARCFALLENAFPTQPHLKTKTSFGGVPCDEILKDICLTTTTCFCIFKCVVTMIINFASGRAQGAPSGALWALLRFCNDRTLAFSDLGKS